MIASSKKSSKNKNEKLGGCGSILVAYVIFYIVGLVSSLSGSNPPNLWGSLLASIFFIGVPIYIYNYIQVSKVKDIEKKRNDIFNAIEDAGLIDYINNFISRFGLGQEKSKNVWERRNYKISWDRINDLIRFLEQKGIIFSSSDISTLLSGYIDKREYDLTCNSISTTANNFSSLSGSDFEKLIYRLFEAMGYSVQLSGKSGDQGGDLIVTKNQDRILIQAKCYKDWTVGNSAVQEAVAAKNHYDCNKAAVITTSVFTKEATELAKTNEVELIPKELLQKMLLDGLKESWN